jgi:hypothetical protein
MVIPPCSAAATPQQKAARRTAQGMDTGRGLHYRQFTKLELPILVVVHWVEP